MSHDNDRPRINRLVIRNYKSIGKCVTNLADLTVLVGRNGAGKSNFLDALEFVAEGLKTSLDYAIKSRGGIDVVRRRSTGHPHNFAIQLELTLPGRHSALYGFEIAAKEKGGFEVKREQLRVTDAQNVPVAFYHVERGEITRSLPRALPRPQIDRLFLVLASGFEEFRPCYDVLKSMGFYCLNPESMKELQSPDAGQLLDPDGRNLSSVIARISADDPHRFTRITEFLTTIVPSVASVERIPLGPKETLLFRQNVKGAKHPWRFYAASMSDGTLRALGALVAVSQLVDRKSPVRLVGIEEPETALHPAATGALMDALREATSSTQIVVTTHSPDLLDHVRLEDDCLLVVDQHEGESLISELDAASVAAVKQKLYSPGELLRMDQLQTNKTQIEENGQYRLFVEMDERK